MFDSKKALLDRLRLPEDTFFELKDVRFKGEKVSSPHWDAMANELAAFANGRGGVCLVGVDDKTREVVGIPADRVGVVEAWLHRICADNVDPPIAPGIECMTLPTMTGEEAAVIKIDISPSLFAPHQSPGGFMHRIGSSKRRMTRDEVARLIQQRSQTGIVRFDEQTVRDASFADLVPEYWERFRTPRSRDERDAFLTKLGMSRAGDDGVVRPTVAGVLMATSDPRRWFPNAFIQAVHYRGDDIRPGESGHPYQLDAADISGPLDIQVDRACRFVGRNMKTIAFKDRGRRDLPQFDMTSVFEALANAVAHRDYSIHGSKIRLRMFANRLEIFSPGALPNGMTIESLPYLQSARYEVVTSLLAKCPVPTDIPWLSTDRTTLMDKRGEGVRIIYEKSERLSGKRPRYQLLADRELLLTIYARLPGEGDP